MPTGASTALLHKYLIIIGFQETISRQTIKRINTCIHIWIYFSCLNNQRVNAIYFNHKSRTHHASQLRILTKLLNHTTYAFSHNRNDRDLNLKVSSRPRIMVSLIHLFRRNLRGTVRTEFLRRLCPVLMEPLLAFAGVLQFTFTVGAHIPLKLLLAEFKTFAFVKNTLLKLFAEHTTHFPILILFSHAQAMHLICIIKPNQDLLHNGLSGIPSRTEDTRNLSPAASRFFRHKVQGKKSGRALSGSFKKTASRIF